MNKIAIFLIFCASSLFAALPPLAQSTAEIRAVLDDSRTQELLGSAEMITDIVRTPGGFLVLTHRYALLIDLVYSKTQEHPGPVQFKLEYYKPVPLEKVR